MAQIQTRNQKPEKISQKTTERERTNKDEEGRKTLFEESMIAQSQCAKCETSVFVQILLRRYHAKQLPTAPQASEEDAGDAGLGTTLARWQDLIVEVQQYSSYAHHITAFFFLVAGSKRHDRPDDILYFEVLVCVCDTAVRLSCQDM